MSTHAAPTTAPAVRYAPPAAPTAAVIVPPRGGDTRHAFGDTIQFKLGATETGGSLALGFCTTPPAGGPPPHRHLAEDELFIVVSGQLEFLVDGAWTAVEPGTVVFLPRGVVHTFRNAGDVPSQHWVLTTPSGFESFFGKCADVFADAAAAGAAPDMGRILAIFAEHRLELAS
jgi:quercetin dioxygenase-like cupin family protein